MVPGECVAPTEVAALFWRRFTSTQPCIRADAAEESTMTMRLRFALAGRLVVTCAALVTTSAAGQAQPGYRPTAANLAAREWFQDARFGLFVHWGVYSVLGDGEW